MSRDQYTYQNLLRDRLQRDVMSFMRSDDKGAVSDMRKLIKGTGVSGIKDLTGDALMDFSRDALAIMQPQKDEKKPAPFPPTSEAVVEPEGRAWLTFEEVWASQQDRGPEHISGIELDVVLQLLAAARAKLKGDDLLKILFDFTGEPVFAATMLKPGQGFDLSKNLLIAIRTPHEF